MKNVKNVKKNNQVTVITKENIIELIKKGMPQSTATKAVIQEVIDTYNKTLIDLAHQKNVKFGINNFGVFTTVLRKATRRVNPHNGSILSIPAKNTVKFSISKVLKEDINK